MSATRLALGALIVAGGAAAFFGWRELRGSRASTVKPSQRAGPHAASVDRAAASTLAMINAPEGATPCESAWRAIDAERTTAGETGQTSWFSWVAPRDDFFAVCATLTPEAQACLVPRYMVRNREACEKARPPDAVLKTMFVGKAPPGFEEPDPSQL